MAFGTGYISASGFRDPAAIPLYQTVINSTLHIFNKTERERGIRIGDSESLLNTQILLSDWYSVRLSGFFPCPPNLHRRYERWKEWFAGAFSHIASTQSLSHINSKPLQTQFPSKTVISISSLHTDGMDRLNQNYCWSFSGIKRKLAFYRSSIQEINAHHTICNKTQQSPVRLNNRLWT